MSEAFLKVVNMSISASWLVIAVLLAIVLGVHTLLLCSKRPPKRKKKKKK